MDGNPAQQAFKELLPYLETLDTQSAAILQLLKDKGLTTDEQFATYLEQAGNISNVKWLAARLRIEHLLSSIDKDNDKDKEEDAGKTKRSKDAKTTEPKQGAEKKDDAEKEETETTPAPKSAKTAENPSKEGSDQQTKKETGSNTDADRDAERNTEKKAS
jgi:hypothetical protein